jgi:Tol biopolymer transport system component
LFYIAASEATRRQLTWVSRTGQETPLGVPPDLWRSGLAIAPDGRRAVAANAAGLWIYDLTTGTRSRVTSRPGDIDPVWLPDGRIAFTRQEADSESVVIAPATGTGPELVVHASARWPSIAGGDSRLVFNIRKGPTRFPAWAELSDLERVHDLDAHAGARFPAISPDGSLLLYVSRETGEDEIWVTRFPSGEGKWQVSFNGGGYANWSPTGDEIFYRSLGADLTMRLWSVRVTGGAAPTFSAPAPLFRWGAGWDPWYGVAPDGQRVLVSASDVDAEDASIRVVRNWAREYANR